MANLIYLRQRLKVVGTIKKTTNAMRLISMSLHSRLRHKKQYLESYKKELFQLLPLMQSIPTPQQKNKNLTIIVGSQKGLCGTFNTALFAFFKNHTTTGDTIIIGKQMANVCVLNGVSAKTIYPELSASNFITLATQLASIILTQEYSSVTLFSNQPKTFFIQQQVATPLWPLTIDVVQNSDTTEYLYEQTAEELSTYLCTLLVKVHLQELLFLSLLAEQSSRFISMDNSTQNAENLLQTMKLQYNKQRQADITRELADLTGSFNTQL